MELLSPAGDLETATAAFQYGADAVYLGMKQFSARADANNFTAEDLAVLTGLAHGDAEHPRKVYVALNTLVRDAELEDVLKVLSQLAECRVDGVILQDMAVAQLARRYFPSLPLHASTQLAVHSVEGMIACRDAGFKRVIAARELTLPEIAAMAAVPGIELEVFVHGALCYSYSGLCLLASVLDGHSGNRGECSYVCRECWSVAGSRGQLIKPACHLMSMKDLALADYAATFEKLGVASLKIEGRKKTPLYVAAVTNYYRQVIDGSFKPGEKESAEADIRAIFSRKWTRFCVPGEKNPEITDTELTGPRGTPAGTVLAVNPGAEADWLRFKVQHLTIEKHDGLQVEIPGRSRPYGFGVEAIRAFRQGGADRAENVFAAEPSTTIEVPLPADHPPITPGMALFCTASQATKRRYSWPSLRTAQCRLRQQIGVQLTVSAEALKVSASCGATEVTTDFPCVPALTPARKAPEALAEDARTAFAKLGDTAFELGSFAVSNPERLFVPTSILNGARRQAAEALDAQRRRDNDAHVARSLEELSSWEAPAAPNASASPAWLLKIDRPYSLNLFQAEDFAQITEVIWALDRTPDEEIPAAAEYLAAQVGKEKVRLALPAVLRGDNTHNWPKITRALIEAGWDRWQIANIAGFELLKGVKDLTADWQLYASNRAAARELLERGIKRVTLPPDDPAENSFTLLRKFSGVTETIIYQDTPLAISAVCANASLNGGCVGKSNCNFTTMKLTRRRGDELIAVNNHCQSIFIRTAPLDRSKLLPSITRSGAKFLRADFIWREYSPASLYKKWRELLAEFRSI